MVTLWRESASRSIHREFSLGVTKTNKEIHVSVEYERWTSGAGVWNIYWRGFRDYRPLSKRTYRQLNLIARDRVPRN